MPNKRKTRKRVNLDSFLKSAAKDAAAEKKRCQTCEHGEAVELIASFMKKRRLNQTQISFRYFYEKCLCQIPRYRVGYLAARTHVINCLKVDFTTGNPTR